MKIFPFSFVSFSFSFFEMLNPIYKTTALEHHYYTIHTSAERWRKQPNTTFIQFHLELLSFKRFMYITQKINMKEIQQKRQTMSFRFASWIISLEKVISCLEYTISHTRTNTHSHWGHNTWLFSHSLISSDSFPFHQVMSNVQLGEQWIMGTANVFVLDVITLRRFAASSK